MRKYAPLLTVALSALVSWSCDSGDSSESGGAGAGGASSAGHAGSPAAGGNPTSAGGGSTGAAAGAHAGGATGSAGATGSSAGAGNSTGPIFGTGGPFAFPQNKKPMYCSLTTVGNASGAVQSAYASWKSAFVTSSGAGTGLRVQRNTNQNDTVSEGIGYGMLAAVYMNDRTTFDGLWTYAKANFDANGLMTWHLSSSGSIMGTGSATDGDEDMGWALLMASDQWSSSAYLAEAKSVISAILINSVAADGMLKPGDGWGATLQTYPDYFSPAYYRVFAKVTNNPNWSGVVIDRNYAILAAVEGSDGLDPDYTTTAYGTSQPYGYDACRTPWRIGMDYCFNGEPRAQAYLTKIGTFFNGVGAANIGDGYSNSGSQTSSNKNMAFIGPAGVAGMAGFPTLLDGAFSFGANNSGDQTSYFGQSLRVLTMLMMSGNFVDFTKP
jgi:endo-1,4-beta-D-glucanase Y